MRLLLLGESAQSARYLTGTFAHGQIDVQHIPARERCDQLEEPFDVVVFSDFPARQLGPQATGEIVERVEHGAGLVMIGGWTSFTGTGNGYRDTPIARLLPVVCAPSDDRRNVSSGLWLDAADEQHSVLRGLTDGPPPVLCGYNAVTLAEGATLVAHGRLVRFLDGHVAMGDRIPLLAVRAVGRGRSVAYASDLVPHWCGGIVDWGSERIALPTGAEVGNRYVTFLLNIVRWAGRQL